MKIHSIIAGALALALCLTAGSSISHSELYRYNYENVLGTSLELKILAASEKDADVAQAAALDEIEREAKILSGYDAGSEFSRWNRTLGLAVPVAPELAEVLGLFDRWRQQTDGALDASAETVTRAWKAAAKQNRIPTAAELAAAVALVKQPHWSLDATNGTATRLSSAPLVLNSLANSYIVE